MTREIILCSGEKVLVDDEDYKLLNSVKWYASYTSSNVYAIHSFRIKGIKRTVLMHQFILTPEDGFDIDHINGEGLDNRRCNLRLVTRRQNLQNRHTEKSSQYPGVSWNKRYKKYASQITINGKAHGIIMCDDEFEAFTAYRVAVKVLTGEDVIYP
jgi:hypothetical protein